VFQDGVELNWLPPAEPNGEVHYVVEYKREDSGSWTSVNTASDSTHYTLTGLHRGTNYTIRVVAVKNANRKESMPMKLKLWWEINVATSTSTATTIVNTRKNSAVTAGGYIHTYVHTYIRAYIAFRDGETAHNEIISNNYTKFCS